MVSAAVIMAVYFGAVIALSIVLVMSFTFIGPFMLANDIFGMFSGRSPNVPHFGRSVKGAVGPGSAWAIIPGSERNGAPGGCETVHPFSRAISGEIASRADTARSPSLDANPLSKLFFTVSKVSEPCRAAASSSSICPNTS